MWVGFCTAFGMLRKRLKAVWIAYPKQNLDRNPCKNKIWDEFKYKRQNIVSQCCSIKLFSPSFLVNLWIHFLPSNALQISEVWFSNTNSQIYVPVRYLSKGLNFSCFGKHFWHTQFFISYVSCKVANWCTLVACNSTVLSNYDLCYVVSIT